MKKIIFLLLFYPAVMPCAAQQPCPFYGTKTMYRPLGTDTKDAPAGYVPVFINYAGRHGARHLANLKEALFVSSILKAAATNHALTPKGLLLKKRISNLLIVEGKGKPGLITLSGGKELEGIAKRMERNYAPLFQSRRPEIVLATTKVERTRQSAEAFLRGLGYRIQDKNIVTWNKNDSVQLRFYDLAPAYQEYKENGNWDKQMERLYQCGENKKTARQIINTFFIKPFADKLLLPTANDTTDDDNRDNTAQHFVAAIYELWSIGNAIQNEITKAGLTYAAVDINPLLTCDELNWLEFMNSAKDFLLKGPGTDINGVQVTNAAPLLVGFINSTDSFLQNGKAALCLRFTHAEAIAPLAAIMGINGASTGTKDILNYRKVWHADSVIPFSANVQWVLYKNKKDPKDVLVKILFNEKPASIPVSTNTFPYYKWADVKRYYTDKLKTLGVSPGQDMYGYLLDLKVI